MNSPCNRIPPFAASERAVLAKAEFFADLNVWPSTKRLDPRAWLRNFKAAEMPYALAMLNAFVFYSSDFTKALLLSAFHGLSSGMTLQEWAEFRRTLILTYVEGENPHPTDSGYHFARLARDLWGVSENQIMAPERALRISEVTDGRAIIFVDDFVGSGDQMFHTWHRPYELATGATSTFYEVAARKNLCATYVPCVSTRTGAMRLRRECAGLTLLPVHELDDRESLLHAESILLPDELRPNARAVIRRVSKRAGFTDDEWQGVAKLGLALAFEHAIPDATLPIFYKQTASWAPLIRKS